MTSLIRTIASAGGQTGGNILDGSAIAKSMSAASGTSANFKNITPAAIEGTVQISKISEFLASANAGRDITKNFIFFEQTRAGGRCRITISLINGPVIIQSLSPEIFDYLNALMAPVVTGEVMTKPEYLALVASIYSKAISDEISGSRIRASVDFPGPVTDVKGGTWTGRKVQFNVPLLDLLVLETPLVYEVAWN